MEIVSGAEALGSGKGNIRIIDLDGYDNNGFGGASLGDWASGPAKSSAPAHGFSSSTAATASTSTAVIDRPASTQARPSDLAPDDLEGEIDGIGPVIVRKLAGIGITTFRQVASWSTQDIESIGAQLDFKGRIEREDWVGQAKQAHALKYGETI